MSPQVAAALVAPLVAGLFGLVPLMVQIATARAQRRDRLTRLNQLRAELEFLERLHALERQVGAQDETVEPKTEPALSDSLSNLWDQYNKLSTLVPSTVVGDKEPSSQHSFLRRTFLLYTPHTTSGWILHTLFYMLSIVFGFAVFITIALAIEVGTPAFLTSLIIYVIPTSVALLILQRRARRNAVRSATQPEEANA